MLNPVHLRTLAMVLRTGSFAEAARRLGYTGSAVSQQISILERQLRTALFERDTASERLLPDALSSCKACHPDIDVQLDEAGPQELMPQLESREIDLAVVYRYNLVPKAWPKTVLTHRVLREDLNELAGETWVSTQEGTSGAAVWHLCGAHGFEPSVSYRSNNYSVIQGLVRAGLGIALVPALGSWPGLAAARIEGSPAFRKILVASSPTTPSPVVDPFIASFRRAARRFATDAVGVAAASWGSSTAPTETPHDGDRLAQDQGVHSTVPS